MISEVIIVTAFVVCVFAFYLWATKNHDYFEKRGMKFAKPTFLLGNTGKFMLFKKYDPTEFTQMIYNLFPNERYGIHIFYQR